ncbi:glutamate-5-semialdehyde dehydrogenase [Nitrospirillum amazonense]|uniref:Gamma-glutamyl phosphate reductase n=1 Tax=Nitrospirillum amazonense TaxID=28077 RepID=A0A560JA45_9PROT|nr:glutamate-5-semialdehyde dehydrogenase [Nitrospirillum amazonense]MDG3440896.1 glutamate-5-semialdehyde dehydrogenase [Nitrospirillum amazonense]TWB68052.1 glutamate-5-semialdehyde dehydrogenase [Nitrospirillum amazonense]
MDGQTVDLTALMQDIGQRARAASADLAVTTPEQRVAGLRAAAAALRADAATILDANARDMAAGQAKGLTPALLDRLRLDEGRLEAMARGLEEVADLPDPLGAVMADWTRPNGLRIQRVRVPLGVIGIIYESRPNVTADAGGLCVKSGNAAILRGGSESLHSSSTIVAAMRRGLVEGGLPADAVQLVPTTDRAAVGILLTMTDFVDVIIPRGGKSLTARVAAESRVPVIKHLDGICHVYLDRAADPAKGRAIALNAKMRRTGICGAMETLLVHRDVAATQLPALIEDLVGAGCEVRGDATVQALDARVLPADDADWDTEYLDAILSVKVVDGVDEAIAHVERHGSHHTDSIVTEDAATAEYFLARVDSGIVLWNASTQFADGGEFGFGAEIGISTGKLHARGPVGAEQLTSYKYVVRGDGQTRP